jgi:hypothetical protein
MNRLLTVQIFWADTNDSGGSSRAEPRGTKVVLSGAKIEVELALTWPSGDAPTEMSKSKAQTCLPIPREVNSDMRWLFPSIAALALTLSSCSSSPRLVVTHRDHNGRPDQWVRRITPERYQIAIDTNGDGRPDVTKTFNNNQLVLVERDRDYNGQVDLVQEYSHGVLQREIHDDDFDGRPESIKTFRPDGSLALIERDPTERGAIDVVEYYDTAGHLTHRIVRK